MIQLYCKCSRCGWLPRSDFYKSDWRQSGATLCKKCRISYQKKYKNGKNKEYQKTKERKQWRQEYNQEYYQNKKLKKQLEKPLNKNLSEKPQESAISNLAESTINDLKERLSAPLMKKVKIESAGDATTICGKSLIIPDNIDEELEIITWTK